MRNAILALALALGCASPAWQVECQVTPAGPELVPVCAEQGIRDRRGEFVPACVSGGRPYTPRCDVPDRWGTAGWPACELGGEPACLPDEL